MSPTIEKAWQRALTKRKIFEGHWLYHGALSNGGYGMVHMEGTTFHVHRLSLIVNNGMPIDSESNACHKCAYRNCFNPEHLYVGTSSQNRRDSVNTGTNANINKTHCPKGHEYTLENTFMSSTGGRYCRECHRISGIKRYRKNKCQITSQDVVPPPQN